MKKSILLIIAFLGILNSALFAQIAQEEINATLSEQTLAALDNSTASTFLQDFSTALIDGNWETVQPFFYQEYYDKYYDAIEEELEKKATANTIQTIFLHQVISAYISQTEPYGRYMKHFYKLKDWTTIEKVFFVKSVYHAIPGDDIIDGFWNLETVFVTTKGKYYIGNVKCAINKQTGKGFVFGSEG